jgi:hypothetical protein
MQVYRRLGMRLSMINCGGCGENWLPFQGNIFSERSHCRTEEITTNVRQCSWYPFQESKLEALEYEGVLTTQPWHSIGWDSNQLQIRSNTTAICQVFMPLFYFEARYALCNVTRTACLPADRGSVRIVINLVSLFDNLLLLIVFFLYRTFQPVHEVVCCMYSASILARLTIFSCAGNFVESTHKRTSNGSCRESVESNPHLIYLFSISSRLRLSPNPSRFMTVISYEYIMSHHTRYVPWHSHRPSLTSAVISDEEYK